MQSAEKVLPKEPASSNATKAKQSLDQRRILRRKYRGLIHEVADHKAELVNPESTGLNEKLIESNKLYRHVTMPREAALDSEFMNQISQFGLEQVTRLHTHFKSYDVSSFVQRVHLLMQGKDTTTTTQERQEENEEVDLDWQRLGNQCISFFKVTPSVDFLLGPLSATPKEKKARKRIQKEKLGKKVTPEEVKEQQSAEGETSKRVEKLNAKLQEAGTKNFFEFVTHPTSFSRTVENLFHVSFLLKEGRAELTLAEKMPVLKPRQPPDEGDYSSGKAVKRQCIVRFDHEAWQNIADAFDIQQSFLPHQDSEQSQPDVRQNDEKQKQKGKERMGATQARKRKRSEEEEEEKEEAGEKEEEEEKGKETEAQESEEKHKPRKHSPERREERGRKGQKKRK